MNYSLWSFARYTLWVALGGALGAVLRFWGAELIHAIFERGFPWGTLFVNVTGSFLMGYWATFWLVHHTDHSALRSFLLIGMLGAFTTFSTFSMDTVELLTAGKWGLAAVNVGVSVVVCVLAAGMGVLLAQ